MALEHVSQPKHAVQFHPESICSDFGRQLVENFLHRVCVHKKKAENDDENANHHTTPMIGMTMVNDGDSVSASTIAAESRSTPGSLSAPAAGHHQNHHHAKIEAHLSSLPHLKLVPVAQRLGEMFA
jgi:hypothetical protein